MCEILLFERLSYARSHGVVEVWNRLAAVHFVLVRLNRDTAERRIGADVVRLPQAAVTGGKAVLEQLQKVNLTAGFREHVEIHVMDVNVAVQVSSRDILRKNTVCYEIL